jgi:hypothetical protein
VYSSKLVLELGSILDVHGLEKKDISRRGWGNLESVKFNRSAGKQGFWLFYVLKVCIGKSNGLQSVNKVFGFSMY